MPFGFVADTSYVHPYILNSQFVYFYYITAIPEGVLSASEIEEMFGITISQHPKTRKLSSDNPQFSELHNRVLNSEKSREGVKVGSVVQESSGGVCLNF